MKVYQEITLLPNADIATYFLWEKVFQQIHLALVESQEHEGKIPIGIAFPEYAKEEYQLGSKLRVFAKEDEQLQKLDVRKWLQRFADYVHITGIRPVPSFVKEYAIYKRQQPKSSLERIARRKAKREGITLEEALKALKNCKEHRVKTPFINMNSQSSQKRFRLFIVKEMATQATHAGFTSYGLSDRSTVPEF